MKSLIILMLLFTIVSCGTDQNPPKIYNYTIVNSSDYSVEIVPFDIDQTERLQNKILMPPSGVLNKIYEDGAPYSEFNFKTLIVFYSGVGYITKVDFVFNNTKKVSFESCSNTACSEDRSIFNPKNNIGLSQIYTITNADYDAAIDCGGNCN